MTAQFHWAVAEKRAAEEELRAEREAAAVAEKAAAAREGDAAEAAKEAAGAAAEAAMEAALEAALHCLEEERRNAVASLGREYALRRERVEAEALTQAPALTPY